MQRTNAKGYAGSANRFDGPNRARNLRRSALLGASAAAMMLALGSTASAQTASVSVDLTSPFVLYTNPLATQTDFLVIVTGDQLQDAPAVSAIVDGAFAGAVPQPGTGFAATVSDNSITATAISTYATTLPGEDRVVDLGLLAAGVAPVEGIGILHSQLTDGSVVTALVENGAHALLLEDFVDGTGDVSGNSAAAITTINEISPEFMVRGQVPITYTSTLTASMVGTFDGNVGSLDVDTGASVAITSVQVAWEAGPGAGSVAGADNIDIGLINDDTAVDTVTASLNVADNRISTQYTGNQARNVFYAEAGGSPLFVGSVVVSNNQANIETSAPTSTDFAAYVTDSSIQATVGDQDLDDTTYTLGSTLNVSGNSITASARGNIAQSVGAGGQPVVGNAIVFEPGISIDGNSGGGTNVIAIPSSDVLTADVSGDLVLYNGQGNQGTSVAAESRNNVITATVEHVDGGGVNLADNAIGASATGNAAIGLIQAGEAAEIDAVVAAANLQTNDATPINAVNNLSQIVMTAGEVVSGTPTNLTGTFNVSDNAITASATGNSSGAASLPTIALDAGVLTSVGGLASVSGYLSEYGTLTTEGGITASSIQENYGEGVGITATVQDSIIHARLFNPNAAVLEDGTLAMNDNVIAAGASGNVAYTGIDLQGAEGSFSAAAASGQYNINNVGATVWNSSVFAFMDDVLSSTVTLDGNTLQASAVGNRASTSVDVTGFTSLTLGDSTWADPSVSNAVLAGLGDAESTGALVAQSTQRNEGAVTSFVGSIGSGTPFVSLFINDARDEGVASVSDNTVSASAIGNQGTTSLTLDVVDLATVSGDDSQIATVSSRQLEDGPLVQSQVVRTGGPGAIGIVASGDLIDSTVTVDDNTLSSFTAANFATNSLGLTGDSYGSGDVAGSAATLSFFDGNTNFEASAEFTLQNVQQAFNADATYSASVEGAAVGLGLTGAVLGDAIVGSVVSVSGNQANADARGNYGVNTVGLTGFSALSTSAGLHNVQGVVGDVTATVIEFEVGIEADLYSTDNSVLTVSENSATARAIGNTGFNQLSVESTVLGGNGGVGLVSKDSLVVYAPYTVEADYAVASWQGMTGNVSAAVTGMALIDLNDGSVTNTVDSSVLSMTDNSLLAIAQSNSVTNGLDLTVTTASGVTGALLSEQRAGDGTDPIAATASAGAGSDFASAAIVTEDLVNTPVTVADNSVSAIAGNNVATNNLTVNVTADLAGGSAANPNGTLGGAVPLFQAEADFALFNLQDVIGSTVTATATPGLIGVLITNTAADSPIAVIDNIVSAEATINRANNTLSLTGATGLAASAALVNSQANSGGDFPSSATATVQFGAIGATVANDTTASPLNVSGNRFIASASGNVATNALNATASSVYGVSGTPTIGGAIPGGGVTAQADYAVLNSQTNNATITATASTLGIGVLSGGPVSGSAMSVQNNAVVASAVGNSASNSIMLSQVAGSMPSASLTSGQVNSASISSSVTGAVVGIGAGGVAGSNAVVTNNSISATSIGNSVRNTIGIGGSN